MIRTAFLAFTFGCCLIAAALAIAPSQNVIVISPHRAAVTVSCPFAAAGYPDGCAAATSGTPQLPTLLKPYGGHRPPWNVAGVDYAVGIPSGTVLKDPTTNTLPGGCSYTAPNVICSSGSPVFNGWDFSLHGGLQLVCETSGTVTATNSNFAVGSNGTDMIVSVSGCGGMILTYDNLNSSGISTLDSCIICIFNGNLTMEYNYMLNPFADFIDIEQGPASYIIEFNVLHGAATGGHPDWIQTGGGLHNSTVEFNTVLATPGVGSQGYGLGFNAGGTIGNSVMAYNTTVTQSGANINYEFGVDGSETTGAVTVHDNYSDTTGGAFGFGVLSFAKSGSACNPCGGGGTSILSHNVNMIDGTLFSNNP